MRPGSPSTLPLRAASNLALRASHPLYWVAAGAAGDFVTQLGDVRYLGVQAADRIVEDREGEAMLWVVGDAEIAGPLPRPQRLVQPGPGCLEVPIQGVDDALWILTAGQPGLEDDGVLDDDLLLAGEVLHPPAHRLDAGV